MDLRFNYRYIDVTLSFRYFSYKFGLSVKFGLK